MSILNIEPSWQLGAVAEAERIRAAIRQYAATTLPSQGQIAAGLADQYPQLGAELVAAGARAGIGVEDRNWTEIAGRQIENDSLFFRIFKGAIRTGITGVATIWEGATSALRTTTNLIDIYGPGGQAPTWNPWTDLRSAYDQAGTAYGFTALSQLAQGKRVNLGSGFLPNNGIELTPEYAQVKVAGGTDQEAREAAIAKYGEPIVDDYYLQANSNELPWRRGVGVSPGRILASILPIDQESQAFKLASGLGDLWFAFSKYDPVGAMARHVKVTRQSRHQIRYQNADRAYDTLRDPAGNLSPRDAQRYADRLAWREAKEAELYSGTDRVTGMPGQMDLFDDVSLAPGTRHGDMRADRIPGVNRMGWRPYWSERRFGTFGQEFLLGKGQRLLEEIVKERGPQHFGWLVKVFPDVEPQTLLRLSQAQTKTEAYSILKRIMGTQVTTTPIRESYLTRGTEAMGRALGLELDVPTVGRLVGGVVDRWPRFTGDKGVAQLKGQMTMAGYATGFRPALSHRMANTKAGRLLAAMPGRIIEHTKAAAAFREFDHAMTAAAYDFADRSEWLHKYAEALVVEGAPGQRAAFRVVEDWKKDWGKRLLDEGWSREVVDELIVKFDDAESQVSAMIDHLGDLAWQPTSMTVARAHGFQEVVSNAHLVSEIFTKASLLPDPRQVRRAYSKIRRKLDVARRGGVGIGDVIRSNKKILAPDDAKAIMDFMARNGFLDDVEVDEVAELFVNAQKIPGGNWTAADAETARDALDVFFRKQTKRIQPGKGAEWADMLRRTTGNYLGIVATDPLDAARISRIATDFTSLVWKPAVLLRIAWPVRVLSEGMVRVALGGYASAVRSPLDWLAWTVGQKGWDRLNRVPGLSRRTPKGALTVEGTPFGKYKQFTQALTQSGGWVGDLYKDGHPVAALRQKIKGIDPDVDVAKAQAQMLLTLRHDPLVNAIAAFGVETATEQFLHGRLASYRMELVRNHKADPAIRLNLNNTQHAELFVQSVAARMHQHAGGSFRLVDILTGEPVQGVAPRGHIGQYVPADTPFVNRVDDLLDTSRPLYEPPGVADIEDARAEQFIDRFMEYVDEAIRPREHRWGVDMWEERYIPGDEWRTGRVDGVLDGTKTAYRVLDPNAEQYTIAQYNPVEGAVILPDGEVILFSTDPRSSLPTIRDIAARHGLAYEEDWVPVRGASVPGLDNNPLWRLVDDTPGQGLYTAETQYRQYLPGDIANRRVLIREQPDGMWTVHQFESQFPTGEGATEVGRPHQKRFPTAAHAQEWADKNIWALARTKVEYQPWIEDVDGTGAILHSRVHGQPNKYPRPVDEVKYTIVRHVENGEPTPGRWDIYENTGEYQNEQWMQRRLGVRYLEDDDVDVPLHRGKLVEDDYPGTLDEAKRLVEDEYMIVDRIRRGGHFTDGTVTAAIQPGRAGRREWGTQTEVVANTGRFELRFTSRRSSWQGESFNTPDMIYSDPFIIDDPLNLLSPAQHQALLEGSATHMAKATAGGGHQIAADVTSVQETLNRYQMRKYTGEIQDLTDDVPDLWFKGVGSESSPANLVGGHAGFERLKGGADEYRGVGYYVADNPDMAATYAPDLTMADTAVERLPGQVYQLQWDGQRTGRFQPTLIDQTLPLQPYLAADLVRFVDDLDIGHYEEELVDTVDRIIHGYLQEVEDTAFMHPDELLWKFGHDPNIDEFFAVHPSGRYWGFVTGDDIVEGVTQAQINAFADLVNDADGVQRVVFGEDVAQVWFNPRGTGPDGATYRHMVGAHNPKMHRTNRIGKVLKGQGEGPQLAKTFVNDLMARRAIAESLKMQVAGTIVTPEHMYSLRQLRQTLMEHYPKTRAFEDVAKKMSIFLMDEGYDGLLHLEEYRMTGSHRVLVIFNTDDWKFTQSLTHLTDEQTLILGAQKLRARRVELDVALAAPKATIPLRRHDGNRVVRNSDDTGWGNLEPSLSGLHPVDDIATAAHNLNTGGIAAPYPIYRAETGEYFYNIETWSGSGQIRIPAGEIASGAADEFGRLGPGAIRPLARLGEQRAQHSDFLIGDVWWWVNSDGKRTAQIVVRYGVEPRGALDQYKPSIYTIHSYTDSPVDAYQLLQEIVHGAAGRYPHLAIDDVDQIKVVDRAIRQLGFDPPTGRIDAPSLRALHDLGDFEEARLTQSYDVGAVGGGSIDYMASEVRTMIDDIDQMALRYLQNWEDPPIVPKPYVTDQPRLITGELTVEEAMRFIETPREGGSQLVQEIWQGSGTAARVNELVEDIGEHGMRNPLLLEWNPDTGEIVMINGHHRLAAAARLGIQTVPVQVLVTADSSFVGKTNHLRQGFRLRTTLDVVGYVDPDRAFRLRIAAIDRELAAATKVRNDWMVKELRRYRDILTSDEMKRRANLPQDWPQSAGAVGDVLEATAGGPVRLLPPKFRDYPTVDEAWDRTVADQRVKATLRQMELDLVAERSPLVDDIEYYNRNAVTRLDINEGTGKALAAFLRDRIDRNMDLLPSERIQLPDWVQSTLPPERQHRQPGEIIHGAVSEVLGWDDADVLSKPLTDYIYYKEYMQDVGRVIRDEIPYQLPPPSADYVHPDVMFGKQTGRNFADGVKYELFDEESVVGPLADAVRTGVLKVGDESINVDDVARRGATGELESFLTQHVVPLLPDGHVSTGLFDEGTPKKGVVEGLIRKWFDLLMGAPDRALVRGPMMKQSYYRWVSRLWPFMSDAAKSEIAAKMVDGGMDLDMLRNIDPEFRFTPGRILPPVKEGHVRLYRAQDTTRPTGRWWTSTIDEAVAYGVPNRVGASRAADIDIVYIDVLEKDLHKFNSFNLTDAKVYSPDPRGDFYLPADILDGAGVHPDGKYLLKNTETVPLLRSVDDVSELKRQVGDIAWTNRMLERIEAHRRYLTDTGQTYMQLDEFTKRQQFNAAKDAVQQSGIADVYAYVLDRHGISSPDEFAVRLARGDDEAIEVLNTVLEHQYDQLNYRFGVPKDDVDRIADAYRSREYEWDEAPPGTPAKPEQKPLPQMTRDELFEWLEENPGKLPPSDPDYLDHLRGDSNRVYKMGWRGERVAQEILDSEVGVARGQVSLPPLLTSAEEVNSIAMAHSISDMEALLYTAASRHNISDIFRNVFPFGEAWWEIIRTWSQLIWEDPIRAARRFQQTIQGGRAAGWLQQDETTGEELFVYPLIGTLMSRVMFGDGPVLTRPFRGTDSDGNKLPEITLKGNLSNINLFTGSYLPGFGPVVQIPTSMILPDKPSFDFIRQTVLPFGEMNINSPGDILDSSLPAYMKRFLSSFGLSGEQDEDYGRIYMGTAIDMYRLGLASGKYSDETPAEALRAFEDAKTHARWLSVVRSLVQFAGPTGPVPKYSIADTEGNMWQLDVLSSLYREKLYNEFGGDDTMAFDWFVGTFGEDPTVLFQAKTVTTRRASITEEGSNWERDHAELFQDTPDGFMNTAYYASPDDPRDPFDYAAYLRQLREGSREPLTLEQWLRERNQTIGNILYQKALNSVAGRTDEEAKAWLRNIRAELVTEYPGYRQENIGTPRRATTSDLITELERWHTNETLATSDAGQGLAIYLDARESAMMQSVAAGLTPTAYQTAQSLASVRFYLQQTAVYAATRHPDFIPLWQYVLSRELAGVESDLDTVPVPFSEVG